jgi:hypothetical protein
MSDYLEISKFTEIGKFMALNCKNNLLFTNVSLILQFLVEKTVKRRIPFLWVKWGCFTH